MERRPSMTSSQPNWFLTGNALASHLQASTGTMVSLGTVWNRLRAASLRSRRPLVGVPLMQHHSRTHLVWTRQQWARVVFTDESRFNLQAAGGQLWVWRRKGQRFHVPNILERGRFGGGSMMVLGGISCSGAAQLVTVSCSMTAIGCRDNNFGPVISP